MFALQKGKYKLALSKYQRMIDLLGSEDALEGEEKTKRDTLYLAAQLNCALCCLKGKDPNDCIRFCDNVLEKDPSNVKALYRKGLVSGVSGLKRGKKSDGLSPFESLFYILFVHPSPRTFNSSGFRPDPLAVLSYRKISSCKRLT